MKKKILALFAIVCVFCCAIGLAACDTTDGGEVAVTEITLDKTELTLTEGESYTFTATIAPENATDQSMEWSSSDESVATVDYASVVAKAEGEATITVTANNGKTATCTVTVVPEEEDPPAKYTVTFNARGGKFEGGTDTYETQVEDGAKLPDVTVTRGDDYVFTGWYSDEYCTRAWDLEEYTVNEKTTVYAGWKYKNKYQSVIDALTEKIKAVRRYDSAEVEILSVFTDSEGYFCFVAKYDASVFSYKTDISGYQGVAGNTELVSRIPDAALTMLKNYNDAYTSENNAYIADGMAY
ncbi:MAG: Ig-like domain-containing protein, partial [Clostridia bacterium]|nr:Ig-like domain-containing protein [Clostridia bacterium]